MPDDAEKTVLVADDDRDVLNLVRFRLERDGLRVLTATDGAEALELVRSERPQVCVLDVMMPKLGGLEVVKRLRDDPGTAATRIIPADRAFGRQQRRRRIRTRGRRLRDQTVQPAGAAPTRQGPADALSADTAQSVSAA
jgi:CheY-like chemotaxis protein